MDWQRLERLRALFLSGDKTRDYWSSEADLDAYDATFARRIAWKWQAVLKELGARGCRFPVEEVVDWGCGSGVAGRETLASGLVEGDPRVRFWDRSAHARAFAARKAGEEGGTRAEPLSDLSTLGLGDGAPRRLLLVSHVLNELDKNGLASLLSLARASTYVLWVEPGSKTESRRLSELHDSLRGAFDILGPCTHQLKCGMLADGNENHWCHAFAPAPTEAFTDPNWSEFSRRLGIDLRSLPFTYLCLARKGEVRDFSKVETHSRVIGEPRFSKGYARVLSCDGQRGVTELILQKRDEPRVLKKLQGGLKACGGVPLYRWLDVEKDKIRGARPWIVDEDENGDDLS
jgi:hypothetical protein